MFVSSTAFMCDSHMLTTGQDLAHACKWRIQAIILYGTCQFSTV